LDNSNARLSRSANQNRDMVGFFAADEFEDLLMAVDECTNAGACEYIELPAGGIMWTSPAISIPVNLGDDEEVDIERAAMGECRAVRSVVECGLWLHGWGVDSIRS
jgi:hypothetical protein